MQDAVAVTVEIALVAAAPGVGCWESRQQGIGAPVAPQVREDWLGVGK